jgi:hypothetical protein
VELQSFPSELIAACHCRIRVRIVVRNVVILYRYAYTPPTNTYQHLPTVTRQAGPNTDHLTPAQHKLGLAVVLSSRLVIAGFGYGSSLVNW